MGYFVHTTNAQINIPKSRFKFICFELLSRGFLIHGGTYVFDLPKDDQHAFFKWVNPYDLSQRLGSEDLVGVLELFRFDVFVNSEGAIIDLSFDGKCGSEDRLFEALAPCLKAICDPIRIDWVGEQGESFRYLIKDGKFQHIDGVVIFEGDEETEPTT